jgi:hypothetical protein
MVAFAVLSGQVTPRRSVVPSEGFVPDPGTAIKIAEAVIGPVYGQAIVTNQRPYKAKLLNGKWIVRGDPTERDTSYVGGYVEVHINKTNACIMFMTHTK